MVSVIFPACNFQLVSSCNLSKIQKRDLLCLAVRQLFVEMCEFSFTSCCAPGIPAILHVQRHVLMPVAIQRARDNFRSVDETVRWHRRLFEISWRCCSSEVVVLIDVVVHRWISARGVPVSASVKTKSRQTDVSPT